MSATGAERMEAMGWDNDYDAAQRRESDRERYWEQVERFTPPTDEEVRAAAQRRAEAAQKGGENV